tara:strand:+ start:129 stop:629 length:501 start_codon:yes stop_codon:yes gene_type:complete
MRDAITQRCIETVYELLGYCYEKNQIRKYVEFQLYSGKLPVDMFRRKLNLLQISKLLSLSPSSRDPDKKVRYFTLVPTVLSFYDHMHGNTKYEPNDQDESHDLYLGTLKDISTFSTAYVDKNDSLVILTFYNIDDSIDRFDVNDFVSYFNQFETLYKISFEKPITF